MPDRLLVETGQFVDFFDGLSYAGSGQKGAIMAQQQSLSGIIAGAITILGPWARVGDGGYQFPVTSRVVFGCAAC